VDAARRAVAEAKEGGLVADAFVTSCGDEVAIVALHDEPPGSPRLAALAAEALRRCGAVGARLGQHGVPANGGIPVEVAELELDGRPSEPVVCFLADKAGAGAFDVHLYRLFADPFNTPSLLTDPSMVSGFRFVCAKRRTGAPCVFDLPDDLHAFLAAVASGECVVQEIRARSSGRAAAAASVGADPLCVVRCEAGFPTVGEALEPFAFPYAVAGWTGAGPLMPVSTIDDAATRLDGPPRVVGLGFQVTGERLVGPRDLLGDRAFDAARSDALRAADYLRRHGPFAPQRTVQAPSGNGQVFASEGAATASS
jgi:fructose 1,6-bisphosphate aldolase/phosphatase